MLFFLCFALNIDCGYTLEPPQVLTSVLAQRLENDVYPRKSQFYYIKVGCKRVYIAWTCLHGDSARPG